MGEDKFKKVKAFFSYTGLLSFLFFNNEDDFVKFHARQANALLILGVISLFIPLGFFFFFPFLFICAFIGAFKAWDGKKWKAPIIWKIPILKRMLVK